MALLNNSGVATGDPYSPPPVVLGPMVSCLSADYRAQTVTRCDMQNYFFLPPFVRFSFVFSASSESLDVAPAFCFFFQAAQSPSARCFPLGAAFAFSRSALSVPLPERAFASFPSADRGSPLLLARSLGLCLEVTDSRVANVRLRVVMQLEVVRVRRASMG